MLAADSFLHSAAFLAATCWLGRGGHGAVAAAAAARANTDAAALLLVGSRSLRIAYLHWWEWVMVLPQSATKHETYQQTPTFLMCHGCGSQVSLSSKWSLDDR